MVNRRNVNFACCGYGATVTEARKRDGLLAKERQKHRVAVGSRASYDVIPVGTHARCVVNHDDLVAPRRCSVYIELKFTLVDYTAQLPVINHRLARKQQCRACDED